MSTCGTYRKGGVSIVHLRIRELRIAAGLSQKELAERLRFTPSAVNQWERGVTLPTTETLPELARALGCSIGELFGETRSAAAS